MEMMKLQILINHLSCRNTIKDLMGNGDSKPRDSTWLFLEKYDHESGQQEPMGKLCVGLWIGPKADGT